MVAGLSVRIDLLGGFAVSVGGRQLGDGAWRLRKAKSLVKLMGLAPGYRLPWEQVGEMLWPDRDADSTRNNLHQALRAARDAIASTGADGHQVLRLRNGVVAFGDEVDVSVDVDDFTTAVEHARSRRSLEAYSAAADLYPGELLPEDRYDDWTDAPRDALREQHTAVLTELAHAHRERGDLVAAIDVLRRLLVHNQLHEPARRELMLLLAHAGRRQEALAEYESLREALGRALDADPDPETQRLYRRLAAGELEAPESEPEPEPAAASEPARTNNLPLPATSLIGRDREANELERLLQRTRLLTLTGVGGAGKTRLALEFARRHIGAFDDGVWLVDLAPSSEPGEVPQAVAEVLGLELPERGSAIPALAEQLAPRRLLLLLDNCEHVIATCAEVIVEILRSCPDVVVLATSREALRVQGETAWRVPSLALPDLNRLPDHDGLARQASVQLFCERASAAAPTFELTPANARTVAELCVGLDGMPLALELAAARVRILSPGQILERLGDALAVLEGGRAGLSRQRTLSATLDWSHDLLDDRERVVFRRLAVFLGSFSLEAAEHVCGVAPLGHDDVLEHLGRLVDQSLVVAHPHGDVVRYQLLETVRQYARSRLEGADESEAIAQRHRDWYCDWAEANDPERAVVVGEVALHHFDIEHDNLRAALRSSLANRPETALRLATSLWRFWLARGHFAEGRRWLESALAADPDPTTLRTRGLVAIAVLDMRFGAGRARLDQISNEIIDIHLELGDQAGLAQAFHFAALIQWTTQHSDVVRRLERACELARDVNEDHILASATHTRGVVELSRGQPAAALQHFDACDELLSDLELADRGFFPAISIGFSVEWDTDGASRLVFEETLVMGHRLDADLATAHLRYSQAWAARAAGELDTAIASAEDSADRFSAHGWGYGIALTSNLLGNLHRLAGDHETARRRLEQSLQLRTQQADRRATGVTLGALGLLAGAEGDVDEAHRYLRQALELFDRIEDGFGQGGTLLNLGVVTLRAGDLDAARRCFDQVQAVRHRPGMLRPSGWVAVMLAEIAAREGDTRTANRHLTRARTTFAQLGETMGLAHCDRLQRVAEH